MQTLRNTDDGNLLGLLQHYRRTEINRKLREDDFGDYIGVTRWITYANQKDAPLKERAAIDAELVCLTHSRPNRAGAHGGGPTKIGN